MAKRYVLFKSDFPVSEDQKKAIGESLDHSYGNVKVFGVEGEPRFLIVKTDVRTAELLRDPSRWPTSGGNRLSPVLTSGAVGNLKRRATEEEANGQVHE